MGNGLGPCRNLVIATMLLGAILPACSGTHRQSPAPPPQTLTPPATVTLPPPTRGASLVGSCRSDVARRAAAGTAIVEWVDLATELTRARDVDGPVFIAQRMDDLGEDTPPAREGPREPGRLVRFEGVTPLRGDAATDLPMLVSSYALEDANEEIGGGRSLLVRIDPEPHDGRLIVGLLVAVGRDGSVTFLGDCRPRWTPALATFAHARGLVPADVLRSVLFDPTGNLSEALLSSPEARATAGP